MAKKEKERVSSPKLKTRAKYKCPDDLSEVIYWTNYFLPDLPLPEIYRAFGVNDTLESVYVKTGIMGGFTDYTKEETDRMVVWELFNISEAGKKYGKFLVPILKNAFANVNKIPTDTINEALFLPDVVDSFIHLYTQYRNSTIQIKTIAKILNDIRKGVQKKSALTIVYESTFIYINEKMKLDTYSNTNLFNLLKGLDADRLRICEICDNIFWAKRANSESCTPRCLNTLNVRRSRSLNNKEKAKKEAERKANHNLIKSGMAKSTKRIKSNGTL